MFFRSLAIITAFIIMPGSAWGQTIGVKTIPLVATEQFNLTPSYYAGMGGMHIALDDVLAEGFVNPARITALKRNLLFMAPYRDSWRDVEADDPWFTPQGPGQPGPLEGSQAQAIPLGAIKHTIIAGGRMRLTTGFALALEQLRHASHPRRFWNPETGTWSGTLRMSAFNWPISGMVALRFPGGRLSVGAGVDAVVLRAVDGVPLLYPGAIALHQKGNLAHYRLGVSMTGTDDSRLDILVLNKRYQMEQEAIYDIGDDIHNKDEEISWLVQLNGRRPVAEQAQVGLELTGQWKWHPKIPDYPAPEIRIPRDPGITRAGRIGVGFSNREGRLLVALDMAMEVIDSKTWGDTTAPVTADDGGIIAAGDPLFSNDYFFINAELRLGLEYRIKERLRLQAGWGTHLYSLDYFHEDYVTGEKINASPQNWWKEPVLTGGLVAEIGNTEWIFHTRVRYGTGQPFREPEQQWWPWWGFMDGAEVLAGGDILVPPNGMTFQYTPVVMYRLTVVYWFGGE